MQRLPGAVLLSTGFGICLVVEPDVVAPRVTTAPLGAVVVVDQVAASNGSSCQNIGAAPVPAAASPAAAQSVYMSTAAVGAAYVPAASSPAAT